MKFAALSSVLVLLAAQVDAAGNEEIVDIETKSDVSQDVQERVSYQCTFRNLWTKQRHPKNFPKGQARWAGPIMWTHTLQFEPWRAGNGVTRGVEKLAEDGFTDVLIEEMTQQGAQVMDWSDNPAYGFSVEQEDFVHMPPLETNKDFSYLSVMAGMDPSPDWYTGFYSFWLIDEYSRTYYDHLKIQTYAWDAGTDAGTTYLSNDVDLDPQLPIERFVPRNAPEGGELRDINGDVPVVGEFECFLVVGEEDMILPDCDWFANPCCNETDTENCGAVLPNGAQPAITPEYAQVLAGTGPESEAEDSGASPTSLGLTALLAGVAIVQWMLV